MSERQAFLNHISKVANSSAYDIEAHDCFDVKSKDLDKLLLSLRTADAILRDLRLTMDVKAKEYKRNNSPTIRVEIRKFVEKNDMRWDGVFRSADIYLEEIRNSISRSIYDNFVDEDVCNALRFMNLNPNYMSECLSRQSKIFDAAFQHLWKWWPTISEKKRASHLEGFCKHDHVFFDIISSLLMKDARWLPKMAFNEFAEAEIKSQSENQSTRSIPLEQDAAQVALRNTFLLVSSKPGYIRDLSIAIKAHIEMESVIEELSKCEGKLEWLRRRSENYRVVPGFLEVLTLLEDNHEEMCAHVDDCVGCQREIKKMKLVYEVKRFFYSFEEKFLFCDEYNREMEDAQRESYEDWLRQLEENNRRKARLAYANRSMSQHGDDDGDNGQGSQKGQGGGGSKHGSQTSSSKNSGKGPPGYKPFEPVFICPYAAQLRFRQ